MMENIYIYAVGQFGATIAQYLRLYIPCLIEKSASQLHFFLDLPLPDVPVILLAVNDPEDGDAIAFNRLCQSTSSIFLPIILRPEGIWFGPVRSPSEGGCWQCALRRYGQHLRVKSDTNAASTTVKEYFNIHHSLLVLAASFIWELLDTVQTGETQPNFIWCLNINGHAIERNKVEGIHRCEICGIKREGSDITTRQLRDHLTYLFK
jgi:bacteriocin biosynthesis cyclodehydratase domain-containing protein